MKTLSLLSQTTAGSFTVPAGSYIVSIFQTKTDDFKGGLKYGTTMGGDDVVGENQLERLDLSTPVFSYDHDTEIFFDAVHSWDYPVDIRVVLNALV